MEDTTPKFEIDNTIISHEILVDINWHYENMALRFDNHIVSSMPTDKLEKLLAMVQWELDNRKK